MQPVPKAARTAATAALLTSAVTTFGVVPAASAVTATVAVTGAAANPTIRADVDGDGKPDTITLSYVRADDWPVLRLSVRTAAGKSSSALFSTYFESHSWRQALRGAADIDGARGKDIVVGTSDTVGYGYLVGTWRSGKLTWAKTPRKHGGTTSSINWLTDGDQAIGGYRFRAVRGVRLVDDLDYSYGAGFGPDHGTIATYKWSRGSWKFVSSKKVKNLPASQIRPFLAWSGSGVKV